MKNRIMIIFIMFLFVGIGCAEIIPVFKQQTIEIEKAESYEFWKQWKDINGDGLTDLLVLIQDKEKVFTYLQTDSGFPEKPTQIITFPWDTLWFAIYDIHNHPGDEMLISTSQGLACYLQSKGIFDTTAQTLIEAKQISPQEHSLIAKELNKESQNPSPEIPVIFSDHTVIYECDEYYQLKQKRKIEHTFKHRIYIDRDSGWSLGSEPSNQLWVVTETDEQASEANQEDHSTIGNEHIEKRIKKIQQDYNWWQYGIEKEDVNADGRQDLVLWYFEGELEIKTTIAVFIRQDDDTLPDRATQIIRSRGLPMHFHEGKRKFSILKDVDDNGTFEILTAELKKMPISADSIVDMLVSKGTDFTISIRQYQKTRGYSNKADFKMDVTALLPISKWIASLITFEGDFNADGRQDLIVRRSPTRCYIHLSSHGSAFYDRKPKLQFDIPPNVKISPAELNNDNISDLFLIDHQQGQIVLFLSEHDNKGGL